MSLPARGLILATALLLAACAGQSTRQSLPVEAGHDPQAAVVAGLEDAQAPASVHDASADATAPLDVEWVAVEEAGDAAASTTPPGTADAPPAASDAATPPESRTEAEDDFALLYGHPEYDAVADDDLPPGVALPASYDPWERLNRRVHALNNFIDRNLATPLARAYVAVVPRTVRLGISNFFNNLGYPGSALNALLQGRPLDSGAALLRFLINTTVGLGGLLDPASRTSLPYVNEDFGQTLAVWGWRNSRYVELPFFGPRTIRDVFGMAGDAPLSLLPHIRDDKVRVAVQSLQLADIRARLFVLDSMREGASDEYALYRDAWLQRRNYQILSDLERGREDKDDGLPDYLDEPEDNPSIPVEAVPLPARP